MAYNAETEIDAENAEIDAETGKTTAVKVTLAITGLFVRIPKIT